MLTTKIAFGAIFDQKWCLSGYRRNKSGTGVVISLTTIRVKHAYPAIDKTKAADFNPLRRSHRFQASFTSSSIHSSSDSSSGDEYDQAAAPAPGLSLSEIY